MESARRNGGEYIDPGHKALKDADCEHRIFHDFRRTAVSRFTRAGIAKELSGHQTDSVFRRYSIPDARMMKDAGEKLSAHRVEQRRRAKTGV